MSSRLLARIVLVGMLPDHGILPTPTRAPGTKVGFRFEACRLRALKTAPIVGDKRINVAISRVADGAATLVPFIRNVVPERLPKLRMPLIAGLLSDGAKTSVPLDRAPAARPPPEAEYEAIWPVFST